MAPVCLLDLTRTSAIDVSPQRDIIGNTPDALCGTFLALSSEDRIAEALWVGLALSTEAGGLQSNKGSVTRGLLLPFGYHPDLAGIFLHGF